MQRDFYLCASMSAPQKSFISFLLLCVFCIYITPKEVMHAFTRHIDTAHHATDGLHISSPHHHCELMKMDQQFSAADIQIPFYEFSSHPFFFEISLKSQQEEMLHSNVFSCKQLRAPPVFVV